MGSGLQETRGGSRPYSHQPGVVWDRDGARLGRRGRPGDCSDLIRCELPAGQHLGRRAIVQVADDGQFSAGDRGAARHDGLSRPCQDVDAERQGGVRRVLQRPDADQVGEALRHQVEGVGRRDADRERECQADGRVLHQVQDPLWLGRLRGGASGQRGRLHVTAINSSIY